MVSGPDGYRATVRARCEAERADALALLEQALGVLDEVVEPEALRKPLRWHLAATVELVQAHRTLFGLPVTYALDMAAAIVGKGS